MAANKQGRQRAAHEYATAEEVDVRFESVDRVIARIDKANEVLATTINQVPTDVDRAVASVNTRISLELAPLRREIDKQDEVNQRTLQSMELAIKDLSSRLTAMESIKLGATQSRAAIYALVGAGGSLLVAGLTMLAYAAR